jgi:parallel beta-helix repeat protein
MGFTIVDGSKIQGCTANNNLGDGIRVSAACAVLSNTCRQNGITGDGAGIHSTAISNRIEKNHVFNNKRGIDVESTSSLIIGNTASANTTNYSIAANNRYGPIVDITASGTAAVSGSSSASTATSTDPWANFSY